MEIIDGKLRVQNRKKADILQDLRDKGYKSFPKNEKKVEAIMNEDADNEEAETSDADHGYDYLLSMSIWSLSVEKVNIRLHTYSCVLSTCCYMCIAGGTNESGT